MSEPDEISRTLDTIFGDYFGPPTEMDLRGVDPATFALGLSYGFDSWQLVRVVANNRRNVATANRHWAQHHPTPEFLSHVVGTDERALGHRRLLDRAHPGCAVCEEQLRRLSGDLDQVDAAALPDEIDFDIWLLFQSVHQTRSATEDAIGLLHIPNRNDDQEIIAEHSGGRDWQITIRDPRARRATVLILWTTGSISEYDVAFENDLADIDAEAPDDGARPERLRIQVTDPPGGG
jgi:hypothetical protein